MLKNLNRQKNLLRIYGNRNKSNLTFCNEIHLAQQLIFNKWDNE